MIYKKIAACSLPWIWPWTRATLHEPLGAPGVHLRHLAKVGGQDGGGALGQLASSVQPLRHLQEGEAGPAHLLEADGDDEGGREEGRGHKVYHLRLHRGLRVEGGGEVEARCLLQQAATTTTTTTT